MGDPALRAALAATVWFAASVAAAQAPEVAVLARGPDELVVRIADAAEGALRTRGDRVAPREAVAAASSSLAPAPTELTAEAAESLRSQLGVERLIVIEAQIAEGRIHLACRAYDEGAEQARSGDAAPDGLEAVVAALVGELAARGATVAPPPSRPGREQVAEYVAMVRPVMEACGVHGLSGERQVTITLSNSAPPSAAVRDPEANDALQACIDAAVRSASPPAFTGDDLTVNVAIVLSGATSAAVTRTPPAASPRAEWDASAAEPETGPVMFAVVIGAIILALGYAYTALVGTLYVADVFDAVFCGRRTNAWAVYIPVAGGFLWAGLDSDLCENRGEMFGISGSITQVAGILLLLIGFAAREGRNPASVASSEPRLTAGPGEVGLALTWDL